METPGVPASTLDRARAAAARRSAPVMFIENVGQFDERARFQVRGGDSTLWLSEDAIWITLVERSHAETLERLDVERASVQPADEPRHGANLRLSFPGANPHPRLEPFDRLDTVVSYFIGNGPAKWHPDVPVWGSVRYADLYPGMGLVVGAGLAPARLAPDPGRPQGSPLPWRLEMRHGADVSAVCLRVQGAEAVTLDGDQLRLTTAMAEFSLPLVAADWSGPPAAIAGQHILHPFASPAEGPAIRRSDHQTTRLQDDPSDLLYATFLGGNDIDDGYGIAVDGSGSAYVTGWTWSSDFPTTPGAFDTI